MSNVDVQDSCKMDDDDGTINEAQEQKNSESNTNDAHMSYQEELIEDNELKLPKADRSNRESATFSRHSSSSSICSLGQLSTGDGNISGNDLSREVSPTKMQHNTTCDSLKAYLTDESPDKLSCTAASPKIAYLHDGKFKHLTPFTLSAEQAFSLYEQSRSSTESPLMFSRSSSLSSLSSFILQPFHDGNSSCGDFSTISPSEVPDSPPQYSTMEMDSTEGSAEVTPSNSFIGSNVLSCGHKRCHPSNCSSVHSSCSMEFYDGPDVVVKYIDTDELKEKDEDLPYLVEKEQEGQSSVNLEQCRIIDSNNADDKLLKCIRDSIPLLNADDALKTET